MRRILSLAIFLVVAVIAGECRAQETSSPDALATELRATETAFAKTMADRDHAAFTSFLADEAVFFDGPVLRGKEAIAAAWARFFEGEVAPFSWQPEEVAVLASGTLGFSSGPVWSPDGERIGTFNSIWKRGPDGRWRIVFDHGCPSCDCPDEGGE